MADDVKVVLDTLNIEDAALVGFSMGGAILFIIWFGIMEHI